ncbi:MAG: hypothetical protein ACU0B7_03575 [Paracoccaceae bacterium]
MTLLYFAFSILAAWLGYLIPEGKIKITTKQTSQVSVRFFFLSLSLALAFFFERYFHQKNPELGAIISLVLGVPSAVFVITLANTHLAIFSSRSCFDLPFWLWCGFYCDDLAELDKDHNIDVSNIINRNLVYSQDVRKEINQRVSDWIDENRHPTSYEFIEATVDTPIWNLNRSLAEALEKKGGLLKSIENIASAVGRAQESIPRTELLRVSFPGKPWFEYIYPETIDTSQPYFDPFSQLPEDLANKLEIIEFKIALPEKLRVEHHHIVAPTGHGKTTLLQSMILDDIATDASVILIDSDGGIIENLLRVIDPERLVLIDPTDIEYPVALNLFDVGWDRIEQYSPLEREMATNGVLELFDFVMASLLGADLTSKQSTAFRYVTRLMMTVPGATILDFLKLFEPGGLEPYRDYIEDMGETAQSFFSNEFDGSEFKATKKQILRRLYGLLENQTFARMFSNPKTKLNIFDEMSQGKIILINTANALLKKEASQIMGRFFIAMIAQAAQERSSQKDRRRTYFYIDEADEYFDDTMITILAKARKYELGLIIAHQHLAQLPAKLAAALAANTAIKFAGGKTVSDAAAMSKLMFTTPNRIQDLPVGTFLAYVKGHEAFPYAVPKNPFAGYELATDEDIEEMRDLMRERYAYPASDLKKPKTVRTPKADPDDVEEASTW